jgi:uncharacterized membrane protein YfcA
MLETLLLITTGLSVGFLVGLTGVGGGALMTPVLILGFNISPVVAIATDLLFATISRLATIPFHNRQGSVDWKSARMVWAGSIPGAVIGVLLILTFLQSSFSALSFVLAFVLLLTSASMFISQDFKMHANTARSVSAFGGGFIGLSVATTSVGAGALGMAIFRALLGGKEAKNLVGTDIVHAIPIALIAGAAYFSAGLVDFELLFTLLIGSIPGALMGAKLSSSSRSSILRKILAVVLLVAAAGILLRLL